MASEEVRWFTAALLGWSGEEIKVRLDAKPPW